MDSINETQCMHWAQALIDRGGAQSVSLGQQSSTSIGGGVAGKPVTATVNITYVRTVDGVESTVPQPPVHFQVLRQA